MTEFFWRLHCAIFQTVWRVGEVERRIGPRYELFFGFSSIRIQRKANFLRWPSWLRRWRICLQSGQTYFLIDQRFSGRKRQCYWVYVRSSNWQRKLRLGFSVCIDFQGRERPWQQIFVRNLTGWFWMLHMWSFGRFEWAFPGLGSSYPWESV